MKNPIYKAHRNALPNPENITRKVLPNGITFLTRSNFNSPTVSIKGYLHSGSIFDTDEKLGLSYLTANGLMTGTNHHDFQALYHEIESVGARLSFSAGTLTSSFNAHCLSEDLRLILGLASECICAPIFPEKEFNRQKTQMLTALAIRAQDTAAMSALLFDQIVYTGHPYERPEEGFPETIQAIQREDLMSFYQQTFGPKGMVVVIVGAVEPEEALSAVEDAFSDWRNPVQEKIPEIPLAHPLQSPKMKTLNIPGKTQADIVMGSLAPERLSPDYFALRLGNNILGEFGMMGRLGQHVREEAGLAYYAYSSLSVSKGPGAWEMIAGVNPRNIDQTIALMTKVIKNFTTAPVTKEELSDTKSYFLGRMPLLLESNSGVAISLMNMEHFNLGMNYFLEYPQKIQAITAQDILQSSRKYLDPDRLATAIAGP
ncbi:MAG: pitrilysin family protein [Chloroflexota bacterium]|nr:pitrilysin family protein [Chloroflexota bacterium]